MESIVYPDGEELTYGYDQGGQITTVTGVTTHGQTLQYVKAITYDDFGQRVFIHYGNDVTTAYQYDPSRRWLSHIQTQNTRGRVFQNTAYSFDKVGDVLSVTNNGYKQVTQTYGYDDLYELTSRRAPTPGPATIWIKTTGSTSTNRASAMIRSGICSRSQACTAR